MKTWSQTLTEASPLFVLLWESETKYFQVVGRRLSGNEHLAPDIHGERTVSKSYAQLSTDCRRKNILFYHKSTLSAERRHNSFKARLAPYFTALDTWSMVIFTEQLPHSLVPPLFLPSKHHNHQQGGRRGLSGICLVVLQAEGVSSCCWVSWSTRRWGSLWFDDGFQW